MSVSNRISSHGILSVFSIPTLALAGLIAASSNSIASSLTAAEEPAPLHKTLQHKTLQATVWTPSPGASAVADEMRESVQGEIRQQMVEALRPDSLVWNGALDGQKLAQELREELTSQMRGKMIAGLQTVLGEARTEFEPDLEEAKATSTPTESTPTEQWLASRSAARLGPGLSNLP
jgi:hypothetical protein